MLRVRIGVRARPITPPTAPFFGNTGNTGTTAARAAADTGTGACATGSGTATATAAIAATAAGAVGAAAVAGAVGDVAAVAAVLGSNMLLVDLGDANKLLAEEDGLGEPGFGDDILRAAAFGDSNFSAGEAASTPGWMAGVEEFVGARVGTVAGVGAWVVGVGRNSRTRQAEVALLGCSVDSGLIRRVSPTTTGRSTVPLYARFERVLFMVVVTTS